MPPAEPINSGSSSHKGVIIAVVVVGIVLALGALSYFFRTEIRLAIVSLMGPNPAGRLLKAEDAISSGRFGLAATQALKAMTFGSDAEREEARSIVEVANFQSGQVQKRIEAVRLTKETYSLFAGKPYEQALQVNELLGFINSAFENYIFDEIFSGEPFQKFLAEGDKSTSIRNLAEHSLALYPTTEAVFRLGQWHGDQIRDLSGTRDLSESEKEAHADAILQVINTADGMIEKQIADRRGQPFDYMVEPRYWFWKTYLYSIVARVYPNYLEETRNSLTSLVNSYETSLDDFGNKRALIAARLPNGYFAFAQTLYEVKGESQASLVRSTLDDLIALVEENPGAHQGSYLATVRRGAAATLENQKLYYPGYLSLSELHPPFKAFLQKYGWKFE